MAQIVYPYNPFNNNINNTVTESFNVTAERNVYYPRACPFFFNNFELYANATINEDGTITGTRLNVGSQFALANPFKRFISKYKANVFSGIILLNPTAGNYVIRYNTVGGPLVLDEAQYAEFIANLMSHDREAYWEDLVDVPTEWPADPHQEPINLVYNVEDMMVALSQLIMVKTADPNNSTALLQAHLKASLDQAHAADKTMVGLGNVDNLPTATINDIGGNDSNKFVTMAVLMEVLKRLTNGNLTL